MGTGKVIAYIVAGILVIFGILFILGAGGTGGGGWGWVIIGGILLLAAFALIFLVGRRKAGTGDTQNVTLNIDLPGNVSMESLKCKSCGGVLSNKDISLVNGAAVVTCPYCKTVYTLTEEPKW